MELLDFTLQQGDLDARNILRDFIPERIFDLHMHIHDLSFLPNMGAPGSAFEQAGEVVGSQEYRLQQEPLYGGNVKKLRLNMIVTPDASMADRSTGNRKSSTLFLAQELERDPDSVGEVIVLGDDSREEIEAQLIHPRIRGFKCYHVTAQKKPTWQASIGEYLPESAWQIAHERGYCITLHMVRDKALSDADNLAYICTMAKRYPNAKLILAHAARAFAAWTVLDTVEYLVPYANVYFDVSAVCEALPMIAILRKVGAGRVLWGSDYPVSQLRGKCVSIGGEFLWLYKEQLAHCASNTDFGAYLIGIENLLALRQACRLLGLSQTEINAIFYENGMRLFGLEDD